MPSVMGSAVPNVLSLQRTSEVSWAKNGAHARQYVRVFDILLEQ